ncbi:hypothetical protein KXD97_29755 [Mycobacterium sp. SMC-8]|uniref:hypothetical protein n=1 Tax=Mycobacterium sp. SMC-8 TaxID=2857060 RepID=UPI0021B39C4B|nr:hypothetical protein [Mycobacterium sp. SMC-8]UXA12058.1 hypothetical protein KXD97_29755 [Mycobacterium sp. SMC-8]
MTVPTCSALDCGGIADDRTGWCAAHRRALTFTAKLSDALSEFLHKQDGGYLQSGVRLTPENVHNVELAGTHIAHGLACLMYACFESDVIGYDETPIRLNSYSIGEATPWRIDIKWKAGQLEPFDDWPDEESDEFDNDEEDEP